MRSISSKVMSGSPLVRELDEAVVPVSVSVLVVDVITYILTHSAVSCLTVSCMATIGGHKTTKVSVIVKVCL